MKKKTTSITTTAGNFGGVQSAHTNLSPGDLQIHANVSNKKKKKKFKKPKKENQIKQSFYIFNVCSSICSLFLFCRYRYRFD